MAKMARTALKKEKWTLTFDPRLKRLLAREARKRRIYPVGLLEEIVREEFNPFGYTDVADSVRYVRSIRRESRRVSEEAFLKEIRAWQKSGS